jgi:hypothetical protein
MIFSNVSISFLAPFAEITYIERMLAIIGVSIRQKILGRGEVYCTTKHASPVEVTHFNVIFE